jgi:hypothetical protein
MMAASVGLNESRNAVASLISRWDKVWRLSCLAWGVAARADRAARAIVPDFGRRIGRLAALSGERGMESGEADIGSSV